MQRIFVLVSLIIMTVACGHKKDAKSFEVALETATGHNWTVAKLHTQHGKYVVYKDESNGKYAAFNMDKWDRKKMTTTEDYFKVATKGVDSVMNLVQTEEYINSGHYEDVYTYSYSEYYDG